MYCKNCGNELGANQDICLKCGVTKGSGHNFCENCGAEIPNPNSEICVNCGVCLYSSGNNTSKTNYASLDSCGSVNNKIAPKRNEKKKYNTIAILSVVFSIFAMSTMKGSLICALSLIAIVFALIALGQIKHSDAKGKTLSIFALVTGIIYFIFGIYRVFEAKQTSTQIREIIIEVLPFFSNIIDGLSSILTSVKSVFSGISSFFSLQ